MNDLSTLKFNLSYMFKNTFIELRYHFKYYILWLIINLIIISATFIMLNLTEHQEIERVIKFYQLSGYILAFWMIGALYFSSFVLSRRGFILNITNLPMYVLVNVQIFNLFILFIISFFILLFISWTNHISLDIGVIGVVYIILMTFIFLIPVCTIVGLLEHYLKHMKKIIAISLLILFLSLPILWLPNMIPSTLNYILELNPFYYLVSNFEEAMVNGNALFYNIPYHLLFLFEVILIYIWTMYLYRRLKDEINMNKQK